MATLEALATVTLAAVLLVSACTPLQSRPASAATASPVPDAEPPATPALPTVSTLPPAATALATPRQPRPTGTPRATRLPTLSAPHLSIPLALAQLNAVVDTLLPEPNDAYGIVLEDVGSGARVARNDQQVFPSASLYKLGVAWTVLRRVDSGALSLDTPIDVLDEDAVEVEPDGGVAPGQTATVDELLDAMLGVSSNAASHAFLRVIGRQVVNQELARIGLTHTHLPEPDEDAGQGAGTAVSTAADMARLLRLVATSSDLSASSKAELGRRLATGAPPDALRDRTPEGIVVLDKTGNLDDASNVAALLQSPRGTLVLVVIDQGVGPGDARTVISRLGEYAFQLLAQ